MALSRDCLHCGERIWLWQPHKVGFQIPRNPDTRSWMDRDMNTLITFWFHKPGDCVRAKDN